MIETLLGGLLGGAFRLAPEILKVARPQRAKRGPELAMQDKALEFEAARRAADGRDRRECRCGVEHRAIELREAVAAQGQRSGVRWADALSVSVRPVITYWFMALYCAAKTAAFAAAVTAGAGGAWQSCTPGRKPIRRCGPGAELLVPWARVRPGAAVIECRRRPSIWPNARGLRTCGKAWSSEITAIPTSARQGSGRLAMATSAIRRIRRSLRPKPRSIWRAI